MNRQSVLTVRNDLELPRLCGVGTATPGALSTRSLSWGLHEQ
jgi:hypothetical protein